MRGHDDLAILRIIHPPHQLEKFDLTRGRQRGFRFVEDEDALPLAALFEEPQKAFAMGMREKVGRYAADILGSLVKISGDGKEALGAEEPAVW